MKLTYNGKIIKESEDIGLLEEYKKEYIREERKRLSNLLTKYEKLNEEKAYTLARNPKDTDEMYVEKLNMVNKDFVEEFENLLKEIPLEVVKVDYKDVPNGKIRVRTNDDVISFGALNGEIRNRIPMSSWLKIEA